MTDHNGKRIRAPLVLVLAACSSTLALAADIQPLIDNPVAAKAFEYCVWVYGQEMHTDVALPADNTVHDSTAKSSEKTIATTVLVEAGMKVALAAKTETQCNRDLKKGVALFDKVLRRHSRAVRKKADFKPSQDADVFTIQTEISRLWVQDQAARVTYIDLQTDDVDGALYWASRLAVANAVLADFDAFEFMQKTLQSFEWLDRHRFGNRTSRQAWTLAQHADNHVDIQKLVLDRMEPYLESGGVLRRDYAYLWDRVAVNTGQLQRYGTQPTWKCSDGKLVLQPMEDPENVDHRRADMGMGTAADDLAEMARNACK